MNRRLLLSLTGLGLSAVAAAAIASSADSSGFKSGVFEPPRPAPAFVLHGSDGSRLTLERYRGRVVVLEFGFTHCKKVCPVTLGKLSQVFDKLGAVASEVQVIFVTVDPKRDSAARLHEYLGYFNKTFIGGTVTQLGADGTAAEIDAICRAYGVQAAKESGQGQTGYDVHHSSSLHLIDRDGKLRVLVPFGNSVGDIVHDIQLLLKG